MRFSTTLSTAPYCSQFEYEKNIFYLFLTYDLNIKVYDLDMKVHNLTMKSSQFEYKNSLSALLPQGLSGIPISIHNIHN